MTPLQMTVAMATIANGGKLDDAADREIDHDGGWQDGQRIFARGRAPGDFTGDGERRSATRCAEW